MEANAKYEKIKIPLRETTQGLTEVTGILGTPEWWPTGQRIGVVLAHGAQGNLDDPLLAALQSSLTAQRYLTLRFNFPFAEARLLLAPADAKPEVKKSKKGTKKTKPAMPEVDAPEVLVDTYRAAVGVLMQDTTSMPAHLFVGGQDIGGRAAAQLSSARARINGVFYLGYPLHPPGQPEAASARDLFRVISPMLFIQGSRDPHCELEALRRTLLGVGAPTAFRVIEDADANWATSQPPDENAPNKVFFEVARTLQKWMQSLVRS